MAIISNVEKCVLFYAGTGEEQEADRVNAAAFFNHRGVELILPRPADAGRLMGELSGLAEQLGLALQPDDFLLPQEALTPTRQLYWLAGFDRAECTALLKEMAAEGLGGEALKAMATDQNLHWTLAHLIYDVNLEHELIGAFMELRQTVQQTEVLAETVGLPPQAEAAFTERLKLAKAMISADRIPEETDLMRRLSQELKMLVTLGMED